MAQLEAQVRDRDNKIASAEENVQNLMQEIDTVNAALEEKKQQIRKETQEYIK